MLIKFVIPVVPVLLKLLLLLVKFRFLEFFLSQVGTLWRYKPIRIPRSVRVASTTVLRNHEERLLWAEVQHPQRGAQVTCCGIVESSTGYKRHECLLLNVCLVREILCKDLFSVSTLMVSSNQDIISILLYIHTDDIIDTILYKKYRHRVM